MLRNVDESYWLNPITRANDDRLYDIAIRGLGLNSNQELRRKRDGLQRDGLRQVEGLMKKLESADLDEGESQPGSAFGGGGGDGSQIDREKSKDSYSYNGFQQFSAEKGEKGKNTGDPFGDRVIGSPVMKAPTRLVPVQRFATETKTRMVPVQRTRIETKTREKIVDGEKVTEKYTVQVPYTEQVAQSYTVQVPITEMVEQRLDYSIPTDAAKLGKLRNRSRRLYRRLAATQEWIENDYYLLPLEQQSPELVAINRF
ncbi:hypothetical protein N9Y42_09755, partial [Mariniblastus sp.]|nr:hypothetical protein [Mariniblastus sp.]